MITPARKPDRIVTLKNVSGGPLPKHQKQCDTNELKSQVKNGQPIERTAAFCPDCCTPTYDSNEIPFKKDEEILLPESAANHLLNSHQWKKCFNIVGQPMELMSMLINADGLYKMEGGKLVPRNIMPLTPRQETSADPNKKPDRIIATVEV